MIDTDKDKARKPEESEGILQKLLESRTLIISGAVDGEMASRVMTQLVLLSHLDPKRRITILINSPGGDVFSGFAIYDAIRFVECPVVTVVAGLAASMGSIIPLAADKGSRFALPHAKFLIHQPLLVGYQGRATDLEIQANEILKDRDRIVKLYAEVTGKSVQEISKDIDRDKWMSAEEACRYGLIDQIVASASELPKG
jgi:ATP-dependent Clp protease protease subunit